MLGQDLELVVERRRAAEQVAGVGVLGDQAQRLLLAAAADHDRRVGPAQDCGRLSTRVAW